MNWHLYSLKVEKMDESDGGGYRAFYPTIGLAVYGVGNSIEETLKNLGESMEAFEDYIQRKAVEVPAPQCEPYAVLIVEHTKSNLWEAHLLQHWISVESNDPTKLLTKLDETISEFQKTFEAEECDWREKLTPAPLALWKRFANANPIAENARFVEAHLNKLFADFDVDSRVEVSESEGRGCVTA